MLTLPSPLMAAVSTRLVLQWVLMSIAVWHGERMAAAIGAPWVPLVIIAVAHVAALRSLWPSLIARRAFTRALLLVPVIGMAVRFYLPTLRAGPPAFHLKERYDTEAALTTLLREVSAAREQSRLRTDRYAAHDSGLVLPASLRMGTRVEFVAREYAGWSARATREGVACTIWVRDPSLRYSPTLIEDSLVCSPNREAADYQRVQSVLSVASFHIIPFAPTDLAGRWPHVCMVAVHFTARTCRRLKVA
jgi:hypothetical protein